MSNVYTIITLYLILRSSKLKISTLLWHKNLEDNCDKSSKCEKKRITLICSTKCLNDISVIYFKSLLDHYFRNNKEV